MRLNLIKNFGRRTREGAPAAVTTHEAELRRSLLACLLWEGEFYEDGVAVAERIRNLAMTIDPEIVARLAIEARERHHLRHAPLFLLDVLTRTGAGRERLVADTIARVVQRADEVTELIAIYWRDGRKPIAGQLKKGLARALVKFDAYELAKYDRADAVKLRDVLFLVHAKPKDEAQAATWKALVDGELDAPDTWEVALSAGADKRATFERLIRDERLGYLALLRNLRKMSEVGVDERLITKAISARKGARRVLPFRYVAAARAAPRFERALDKALRAAIHDLPELSGRTIVLVDVSGSMSARLSRRSDLTRMDAAAALASVIHGERRIFTFSNEVVEVPARNGMAGVDAIIAAQPHAGTLLGAAVARVNAERHERLIVISDEQSHDAVPVPVARHAYMINVASNRNGVGYGAWTHMDGFSENVIRFVHEHERERMRS